MVRIHGSQIIRLRGSAGALRLSSRGFTDHSPPMKKDPFRLTPYQVQWLLIVGFLSVGYALYLRYLARRIVYGLAGM